LRLDPGLRYGTYAVFAALLITGIAWLAADQWKDSATGETWQAIAASMLMLHGGTAMVALVLLGALIPLHLQRSWRAGKNRVTGTIMATFNTALIVTAFGLYYAGSDTLRMTMSGIHIAAGLGLPALILAHVVLGRRARATNAAGTVRREDLTGALRPATSAKGREFR
jgi:hypothetical protein